MSSVKSKKPTLVLVHGWGLNKAIWEPLQGKLSDHVNTLCIDLPGYGQLANQPFPNQLNNLARELLAQAPEKAHWCGWSLGGMALIEALSLEPQRFSSATLLCTTPKFVKSPDWDFGVDMDTFESFADQLKRDYRSGIKQFLLLQAGAGAQARAQAKQAADLLTKYPDPSAETLMTGLDILNRTDLRGDLSTLKTPCLVISGRRDRVVHPNAGGELNAELTDSRYELLNSEHAPHLSSADDLCALLTTHIAHIENNGTEIGNPV